MVDSEDIVLCFIAVLTVVNCCPRVFVNFFSETDGRAHGMPDLRELCCMLQFSFNELYIYIFKELMPL